MPHDKADTEILNRPLYAPGQVIFRAADIGLSAYLIRSGTVEIYKKDGGLDVTIALLQAGEMFGEMALFNAGRRSTYARARTACELIVIAGSKIERLIENAEPGAQALVRVLVRRMADLNDRIETCPVTGKFRVIGTAA
jgi:CRP-like cAMP-binding protein